MKILYIINKMEDLAGIERILSCKMNYLSETTDHSVYLTTYEQRDCPLSYPLNSKIKYFAIDSPVSRRGNLSFIKWSKSYIASRLLFRKQFKALLNKIHPDIVISTVYSYEIIDIIIKFSYKINAKTIFESHIKGDTVSIAKYQCNHLLIKLTSIWDHHLLNSLKDCDCIVSLTKDDASYWKQYAAHTEIIPNMITISPKEVKDYSRKRVIAVGRYSHQKGFDLLLEAWHKISEQYRDWQLYIFGNGERREYQRTVDNYAMNSNVHLLPATEDIAEEYSKSSIYVMSSRFEGFPLVLGEAMSCGLPCVSFDCPYGPKEIISNGEDGIIVENGNISAMALALEKLMANVELRQMMGRKAAKNIVRYSPQHIMAQWNNLFKTL